MHEIVGAHLKHTTRNDAYPVVQMDTNKYRLNRDLFISITSNTYLLRRHENYYSMYNTSIVLLVGRERAMLPIFVITLHSQGVTAAGLYGINNINSLSRKHNENETIMDPYVYV